MRGLDCFREHFAAWEGRYILIGGAAVDILMDEAGLPFRVTKDLDIVLVAEALDADFARAVWDFVELGGYETRQKSTGEHRFYRFHTPKDASFPYMLELFSRVPDGVEIDEGAHLAPVPVADDVASLSAILLDDEYYEYVLQGRCTAEGLVLLDAEHLIPMKAKAWLDLSARRDAGADIDDNDIKKHGNDVIRLWQLLPGDAHVALSEQIASDLRRFLDNALAAAPQPKTIGVPGATLEAVEAGLRMAYGVEA